MNGRQPGRLDSSAGKPKLKGLSTTFALQFGLLLGLALVKFGNVVVMEKYVSSPTNIYEVIFNGWPLVWGYWLLGGVTVMGVLVARWRVSGPKLVILLPLLWLVWQCIAA